MALQEAEEIIRDTWLGRASRRILKVLLVTAAVLLVLRLAAPYAVRSAINRRLSHIPDYSGHVKGITLHVWRGAYRMTDLEIYKTNGSVSEPFVIAERIDFSIAWGELLKGRLVSRITARNVALNFVEGANAEKSQLAADKRWQDVINDLFPINITYLEIRGGVLRFVDETQDPHVDIAIRNLNVSASGLQNRATAEEGTMPARIDISGTSIGDGKLRLFTRMEPLADQPHFQLAMEVKGVSLPALNDMLGAYAKVKVSQGRFDVVAQMAMGNGHYEGYVKPFITSLEFAESDPEHDSIGRRIWKSLVSTFAQLAKNRDSQQIATRIPFTGDAKNFDLGMWKTIENGLHHGFIKALPRGFEGTTNPDGIAKKPDSASVPSSAPAK
jgi:hypothetical protein